MTSSDGRLAHLVRSGAHPLMETTQHTVASSDSDSDSEPGVRRIAPHVFSVAGQVPPTSGLGRVMRRVRALILGPPLPSRAQQAERLTVLAAVALIGSDMIASSVYGPEEMILHLGEAGPAGIAWAFPITTGIALLLAILAVSYLQTIKAYPNGAGGYIVAKDNFGPLLGVIGAAALLIDYTLDVAVSIATGIQSLTSAIPQLADWRVVLCLAALVLITLANLRGIRAAGLLLSAPVYIYVLGTLGVLSFGVVLALRGALPAYTPPDSMTAALATQSAADATAAVGVLLLLRAFSSGAVALTGIEAISNGVPYLKEPSSSNASRALVIMAALFATMFLGIGFLASQLGVMADPSEVETVHSQITRTLVGRGPIFLVVEGAALLMLVLAANTGFADFPRLLALLSQDSYLPGAFATRGRRLAFSNGILTVAGVSAVLLVAFGGSLNALAPLFTIGAFLTFTLSQAGMVQYHRRHREAGWHWRLAANALGALTTAVVLVVVLASKFRDGAWLIVICLPILVYALHALGTHQQRLKAIAAIDASNAAQFVQAIAERTQHKVLVPVAGPDRVALHALGYLLSLLGEWPVVETRAQINGHAVRPPIEALHVTDDLEAGAKLQQDWQSLGLPVPLVLVESPRRDTTAALLQYIAHAQRESDGRTQVTVVIPETTTRRWWHPLVRNYLGSRLKLELLSRPDVSVMSVPLTIND
ncbi:MAG: APC family permease [Chloroflexi bacterium]|nr:APC family permease [Chloroflexota bacterium]